MRLNRFLAAGGLGSRRKCEELILAGRVTINGQVCETLATEVTERDFVKVGSRHIQPDRPLYVLLHKPRGFLSTAADTHERRTVFDLLPPNFPRLFHVGRLDRDSAGLLILTNDGDLSLRLTHPRYKIDKEYEVTLDRPFNVADDKPKMLKGMHIEGGRARVENLRLLTPTRLRVVLRQGLKRQIRHMFYKLGYEVEGLVRTRIGDLRIGDMRPGEWRNLTATEIKSLQAGSAAKEGDPAPKKGTGRGPERAGAAAARTGGKPRGALSGQRRRGASTPRGARRP